MVRKRSKQRQETDGSGRHFFKLLVGDFTSKLCIPPAFAKYIEVDKCADSTINSHMGSAWAVKLHKHNNILFFKDGWQQFIKCHMLQYGDFLLFKYNGNLNFDVRIFGKSGCERVAAYVAKNDAMRQMKEEPEELSDLSKDPLNDSSISRSTRKNKFTYPQQVVCPHNNSRGILYNYSSWKQSQLSKEERERTQQVVQTLNLSQPHFVAVLTKSNIFLKELWMPKKFLEAFPLESSSILTLRSPNGSEWEVRFIGSKGYGRLAGGWQAFVAAHNLMQMDICVFELTEIKDLVMNVYIFKVADATAPNFHAQKECARQIKG